jgi:hypothetical protein
VCRGKRDYRPTCCARTMLEASSADYSCDVDCNTTKQRNISQLLVAAAALISALTGVAALVVARI